MAEIGEQVRLGREFAGHVIVVEVKNLEIPKAVKLRRKREVEDIVGEIEAAEVGNVGDLRRDGAGDGVGGGGEVKEEAEVADVRGEEAGEAEVGDVDSNDVAAGAVAGDPLPSTVVGTVGVPRGEGRLRVVGDGGLDGEQGAVLRHPRRSSGGAKGEVEVEDEEEK